MFFPCITIWQENKIIFGISSQTENHHEDFIIFKLFFFIFSNNMIAENNVHKTVQSLLDVQQEKF